MNKVCLILLFIFYGFLSFGQANDMYETRVSFPADYVIGDYVEFLMVTPADAGSSGYYEISIAYTRGNIAAAATHIASIGHSNPDVWRELGRVNSNGYIEDELKNFTIDCNTASNNVRFRIRAIGTHGISNPLPVDIKVRSINKTLAWTALSNRGNDLSVNAFLPMTNEWDLYVGNPRNNKSAALAIKALTNGNVGIGVANPQTKLAVNGTITTKEVKVTTAADDWPDYVFKEGYVLTPLIELEKQISRVGHLPELPSAHEVKSNGQLLGEINKQLIKKVEELTLYLIDQQKQIQKQDAEIERLSETLEHLLKNGLKRSINRRMLLKGRM